MKDLLLLPPALVLLARRAGAKPVLLALGVALLGCGLVWSLALLQSSIHNSERRDAFMIVVVVVAFLAAVAFRTVASAAYGIAIEKTPASDQILSVTRGRFLRASAVFVNALGSVFWSVSGVAACMGGVTGRSTEERLLLLLGPFLLGAAFLIHGRHVSISTALLLAEGPREGSAHRKRLDELVGGRTLLAIATGAIPFFPLIATFACVYEKSLTTRFVPASIADLVQFLAAVLVAPLAALLDALAGAAGYGILAGKLRPDEDA